MAQTLFAVFFLVNLGGCSGPQLFERDTIGMSAAWTAYVVVIAAGLFQSIKGECNFILLDCEAPSASKTTNLHRFSLYDPAAGFVLLDSNETVDLRTARMIPPSTRRPPIRTGIPGTSFKMM